MEFCDDLLVEIFSRLPFESLARFKCVSRSWRALISGGYLRRRLPLLAAGLFVHVPRDGDSAGGGGEPRYATACAGGGGLEFCDMSFFPLVETARVVDACEGLLLYRVWALDSSSSSPGSSCQWILTNTVRVNDVIINGGRWPVTEVKFLAFHPDIADVVYLSSPAGEVASCDLRKKEIVSSWKLGAEHHIVRFWLLSFSSGLMNCLGVASNL
uniref:F-box domain-containing protein n=1 Tax=Oryza brachyantha TaxID=4533 RepID=J3MUN6_ORYBR